MQTSSALLALFERNRPVASPHKGQWRGALFSLICLKQTVEQTVQMPVIWDAIAIIMTSLQWDCDEMSPSLASLSVGFPSASKGPTSASGTLASPCYFCRWNYHPVGALLCNDYDDMEEQIVVLTVLSSMMTSSNGNISRVSGPLCG